MDVSVKETLSRIWKHAFYQGNYTSFSIWALRKFSVCGGRRRDLPEGDDDTTLDP